MAKRCFDASNLVRSILQKKAKTDADTAGYHQARAADRSAQCRNPYLSWPVEPENAIASFLTHARDSARKSLPAETKFPVTKPFCEIEARIGILKLPFGLHDRRVTSSGAKKHARAFECSAQDPRAIFESGVSRSHFVHWTRSGLSETSPISLSLLGSSSPQDRIQKELLEVESVETVYGGYNMDHVRVCFPGVHPAATPAQGKMEHKQKLSTMDLTLPAAPYDIRMTLATEQSFQSHVQDAPPKGWTTKRIKRRRSYTRRDKRTAFWQLDVTEVTTSYRDISRTIDVTFEIEMELNAPMTLQLVNEENEEKCTKLVGQLSSQLWWMLYQINPLSDVLNVENYLKDHPDKEAVGLALAQCGALKKFMDSKGQAQFVSPIGSTKQQPSAALANLKFIGCMPVNFSRHNIEEVQRSADNGYFLSEKTDGVRHFMIFAGKTAVLVNRDMKGKQIVSCNPASAADKDAPDPMAPILSLIKPGTVLDGEVVMHRKLRRPVFIVFDVLAISTTEPVLQLPFEQRLRHLRKATFRTPTANRDMFSNSAVMDLKVPLPLVRKNFVKRMDLDDLLSHVTEERGMRSYRNGDVHYHLTDGIIFQPNTPYVCGTDHHLLKWKYLDTVTIDVEILPPKLRSNDDNDVLRVGVLGEEGAIVDMTRCIHLPDSERCRLEADREETGLKIAEVGFDASTGEWYYVTMRPDKSAPNHISAVFGAMCELAESLTVEELRYRMSVPIGGRDTCGTDVRRTIKHVLEQQRKKNMRQSASTSARN